MRLVGNAKVAGVDRDDLRKTKALKQGLELRGGVGGWWPQLDGLSERDRAEVVAQVRDFYVWEASAPRFTTDGRRVR